MKTKILNNRGATLYITLLIVVILVFLSTSLFISVNVSSQKISLASREQLLKLELENVMYEYLNYFNFENFSNMDTNTSYQFDYETNYVIIFYKLQTNNESDIIVQRKNSNLQFYAKIQFEISNNQIDNYYFMNKGYLYE